MDLIAHRGEPQNGAPDNSGTPGVQVQKITPDLTPEFETLRQENGLLRRRIEELEADREDWKGRERDWQAEQSRLQGIIERQTYALPKPQSEGVFARLVQWVQGR